MKLSVNKKIVFLFTVFCSFNFVYSQNSSKEEKQNLSENEIELPDVTTVISGEALTAGKDSVPDYKKILPDKNTGSVQLPVMPAVQNEKLPENEYSSKKEVEKDVYAEGKIGGGYPFCFTGDFSIFRMTGDSPFELSFNHEAYEDFAQKKSADGYFLRQTSIEADKKLSVKNAKFNFSGWYKNKDNGLQSASNSFTDYLYNDIGADVCGEWNLNKGWYIFSSAGASYYNRYGIQFENSVESEISWEKNAKYFSFSPEFAFGWKNYGFDLNFASKYETQLNMKDSNTLQKALYASSAEAVHRGQFTFNFSWENDFVSTWAKTSVVAGTSIGNNDVIIPFGLGATFLLENGFSSRKIILSAEGGLDSFLELAGSIEKDSPFAVLYSLSSEQSDWYGKAFASVPVKDVFSLNVSGEFRKTAFGNGIWQADYSSALSSSGFYLINQEERTDFNTQLVFTADFEQLKLSGGWKSYWLDIPSDKEKNSINASVLFEGKNSKWNARASVVEFLGDDADKVPVVGAEASLKASRSIRLALEATDIIKLLTGKTRDFAHSQYKQNCGHVMASAKFQF